MLPVILLAALIAVAFLAWNLQRSFASGRIDRLIDRRRKTSRFASRGIFIDAGRRLDVALSIDRSTFFYENGDMHKSIDLRWIHQVEYDTRLGTGVAAPGGKVLRLRSQSRTLEFVLPDDVVARWHTMLPQRQAMARAV